MEEVEVAVALAAGVGVVAIVLALARRRRATDAHSVDGYRQTLDVLSHLGGSDRGVESRSLTDLARGAPRAAPGLPPRAAPGAPASGGGDGGVAGSFDDLDAGARHPIPTTIGNDAPRRDRSLLVMERPARRLAGPVAAVVLIVAVGAAAAYVVSRSHHAARPPKQATSSHSHTRTPPTTSLPTRYTAVSSTSASATYEPPKATYSITIGATTSDCWMSVTTETGTTVLAQTFAPGASASLSLTGHSTIDIGAPSSAKVSIGGVPVVLPSGIAGPFTVTLVPR